MSKPDSKRARRTHGSIIKGENSYYNDTSYILAKYGHTITIGDNVSIGHFCYISTSMHKTDNPQERFTGDIVIEDNVWIGNGAVIYPNVTIGHDSVIGANTVITRDVPPYSIVKVVQETVSR